jgi:hypothetical protein
MKSLQFIKLAGIATIVLAQPLWAAGHGGGGGGGFGGGAPHIGGFGGGPRVGGFGGVPRMSGFTGAPHVNYGVGLRGGGVGFPMRPSMGVAVGNARTTRVQPFVPQRSAQSSSRIVSGGNRVAPNANRGGNRVATSTNQVRRTGPAAGAPRPSNEAALARQHHVFARDDASRHGDWDRRHAHFSNGHWWCWDGGYWIGLDDGYYPWDFYPYYAADYYPYDYYTDQEQPASDYAAQQPDPTVTAVQQDLTQLGYYNGPIDGLFGAATRTAVTHYQTDRGLQVSGSLTSDTMQSLGLPQMTSN